MKNYFINLANGLSTAQQQAYHKVKLIDSVHVFSDETPHVTFCNFDSMLFSENSLSDNYLVLSRADTVKDRDILYTVLTYLKERVSNLSLYLPYFPGARYDRHMQFFPREDVKIPLDTCELRTFAHIINSFNLQRVFTLNAHSPAVSIAVNRHVDLEPRWMSLPHIDVIVSPDEGASKKIKEIAHWNNKTDVIYASKKRDAKTGKLSGFSLNLTPEEVQKYQGKRIGILDDICDRGGTFIGLGELIRSELSPSTLSLEVTHALLSVDANETLPKIFDFVYITDSVTPKTNITNNQTFIKGLIPLPPARHVST